MEKTLTHSFQEYMEITLIVTAFAVITVNQMGTTEFI